MTRPYFTPDTAEQAVGQTFVSRWITVDQERINEFSRITEDPDPHHIDPQWCAENSPWGSPISFGFLTVGLITPMLYDVYRYPLDGDPADGYPASFGCNRLRLVAPVPAGSRIRAHITLAKVEQRKPDQKVLTLDIHVEIEGHDKPALVAQWLMMWISGKASAAA